MINYITLGNGLKRDFNKPTKKFISDMVFGISASKSCRLTGIGRALKEDISIKKTVERLGRNLSHFSGAQTLMQNYLVH
jgi:hypothetical protein